MAGTADLASLVPALSAIGVAFAGAVKYIDAREEKAAEAARRECAVVRAQRQAGIDAIEAECEQYVDQAHIKSLNRIRAALLKEPEKNAAP